MAILDGSGRHINPNRNRIRVGDLGELNTNREWRKFLRKTRDGDIKQKEARQRCEAQKKRVAEQNADRLQYRGF